MKNRPMTIKLIVAGLLSAFACGAQGIGLSVPLSVVRHPIATVKSAPADLGWLIASAISLESANAVDYATTLRGPVLHPGQYCEQNELFTTSRCTIDAPRFTGVKIGVAALGAAEWLSLKRWRQPAYVRTLILVNFAGTVPLAVADIGNLKALTR